MLRKSRPFTGQLDTLGMQRTRRVGNTRAIEALLPKYAGFIAYVDPWQGAREARRGRGACAQGNVSKNLFSSQRHL